MEEIFNSELGKNFLVLTKASFKVSDLIPDIVFREKIKNHIFNFYKIFLSNSSIKNYSELVKEIDTIDSLFYLAGYLNLAKEENIKILRDGFLVFKSRIILLNNNANDENKNAQTEKTGNGTTVHNDNLDAKQKKIIEKFNSKNILKLAEILELFPGISERTIRNEMTSLIELGKITRSGRGNGSFYKLLE